MSVKEGFLLIELLISFTLAFFLIFITAHYIVEIKKIQQQSLSRIELLSSARNIAEQIIVKKSVKNAAHNADYTMNALGRVQSISVRTKETVQKSTELYVYVATGRDNEQ